MGLKLTEFYSRKHMKTRRIEISIETARVIVIGRRRIGKHEYGPSDVTGERRNQLGNWSSRAMESIRKILTSFKTWRTK